MSNVILGKPQEEWEKEYPLVKDLTATKEVLLKPEEEGR